MGGGGGGFKVLACAARRIEWTIWNSERLVHGRYFVLARFCEDELRDFDVKDLKTQQNRVDK